MKTLYKCDYCSFDSEDKKEVERHEKACPIRPHARYVLDVSKNDRRWSSRPVPGRTGWFLSLARETGHGDPDRPYIWAYASVSEDNRDHGRREVVKAYLSFCDPAKAAGLVKELRNRAVGLLRDDKKDADAEVVSEILDGVLDKVEADGGLSFFPTEDSLSDKEPKKAGRAVKVVEEEVVEDGN